MIAQNSTDSVNPRRRGLFIDFFASEDAENCPRFSCLFDYSMTELPAVLSERDGASLQGDFEKDNKTSRNDT
jgi:hypothetical protein